MTTSGAAAARNTSAFALLLASIGMALPAISTAATNIAGYVLVSNVSSGPTTTDFTYQIKVHNGAPAISNTVAIATSTVADSVIIDGSVWVGSVAAATTVIPAATIVIRQTKGVALALSNLSWTFTTEMDPAVRAQSLQDLTDEFGTLTGLSDADRNAALSAFAATRPEFSSFGVQENDFWAKYPDGRVVVVIDNRGTSETPPPASSAHMAGQQTGPSQRPAFNGRPAPAGGGSGPGSLEIPGSSAVRLMSAMGPNWADSRSSIADMLQPKAYNVNIVTGTVDDMKAIGGDGVLYISSHGGIWLPTLQDPIQVTPFALWTSSPQTSALDESYDNALRLGRLVYMIARNDRLDTHGEKHYAITTAFVDRYWTTFARNSMVFIDACKSNGTAATPFEAEIMSKGATIYMGWSGDVGDAFAGVTGLFMFDRMTGANSVRADSPPQRPFPWPDALTDLANHGLSQDVNGTQLAVDTCTSCQTAFGLLVPSIQYSDMGNDAVTGGKYNTMYLEGMFGSDPGGAAFGGTQRSVSLGGTEIPIDVPWASFEVPVKARATGAGSVGPYYLTVRDHVSNGGMLSEWVGTFTTYVKGPGDMVIKIFHRMRFRGDYQASRFEIHAPPTYIENLGDALGSRESWSCGGSFTQPTGPSSYIVYTWSGSKTSTLVPFNKDPPNLIINMDSPPSITLTELPNAGNDSDCNLETEAHGADGNVETSNSPFGLNQFIEANQNIDILIDPTTGALMGRKLKPVKMSAGMGANLVTVTQSFPDISNNYPPDLTQGR